jgi:hypothetical protein
MVSVYAALGPQAGVTTTGAHQVGIDFSGHLGLVREVDGRAGRHDAPPGAVYVTGRSPITWLEVSDPTEAVEIYPDRDLVERLAGNLRDTRPIPGEVRPSFAEPDGVVFAVASRLRRAHLDSGALTDIALRSLVGTGAAASPSGDVDLRALVLPIQSDQVTVSAPAQSVRLEKRRLRS